MSFSGLIDKEVLQNLAGWSAPIANSVVTVRDRAGLANPDVEMVAWRQAGWLHLRLLALLGLSILEGSIGSRCQLAIFAGFSCELR